MSSDPLDLTDSRPDPADPREPIDLTQPEPEAIDLTDTARTTSPVRVLGLSGSLRRGSLNTALLRAAAELAPDGMDVTVFAGLAALPHYNADIDTILPPEAVIGLRDVIRAADGLLIVTPEYNYGVPGVLKNLIDWASRPHPGSSLEAKPVAIMGAAPDQFGTVRAQLALRQSLLWTRSRVVTEPEVMVFHAAERFDPEGRLRDQGTAGLVQQLLGSLHDLIVGVRGEGETGAGQLSRAQARGSGR